MKSTDSGIITEHNKCIIITVANPVLIINDKCCTGAILRDYQM